jgi:N-acetylmuramoyl-L-alanine amidase
MPKIDITEFDSPNQSARTLPISRIVIHNTDNNSLEGSVDWLCRSEAQASAHLIIGRDGKTACIVDFGKASWNAGSREINHSSIGIEVVADKQHQGMTEAQEKVLVQWIRWMQYKYGIKTKNIITHRTVAETDCPCWIFPTEQNFYSWKLEKLA